jgi:hypothetical protein
MPSAAEGKFTLTPDPSPAGRGVDLAKDRRVFLHPSPSGRGAGGEGNLLLRCTGHRASASGRLPIETQP